MIRNVEQHNEDLRRQQRVADLETIRQREREERERRTGVRDNERVHRQSVPSSTASGETSNQRLPKSSADSDSTRKTRKPASSAPGFAVRAMAIGLSGAIGVRKEQDKKDREIRNAVDLARVRAKGHETSKGKERASSQDLSQEISHRRAIERPERGDEGQHSRKHRQRSEDEQSELSGSWSRSPDRGRSSRAASIRQDYDGRGRESSRPSKRSRSSDYNSKESHRSSKHYHNPEKSAVRKHDNFAARSESNVALSKVSQSRTKSRGHIRSRSASTTSTVSTRSPSSIGSEDKFIDVTELPKTSTADVTASTSKMDRYFSSTYNPALDVSIQDLTDPKTGLIAEGNFDGWDKMLSVLKKRKEDKAFGVSRAREEDRESQLRKVERQVRREEKEARRSLRKERHKTKRRRKGSSNDDNDVDTDSDVGKEAKMRSASKPVVPKVVVLDGFEYGKKGSTRAWDLGKEILL